MTVASFRNPRLNVGIAWETNSALLDMCDREQITLTEAVHRLVGYGYLIYRAAADGKAVTVHDGPEMRHVLVLDPPRTGRRVRP